MLYAEFDVCRDSKNKMKNLYLPFLIDLMEMCLLRFCTSFAVAVAVAASAAGACAVAAAAVVVHLVGQLQPLFPDSSLAAND